MTENIYETPKSEVSNSSDQVASLTQKEILFSFKGRIPRKTYWLTTLAMMAVFFVIMLLISGLSETMVGIVVVVLYIPLIWISLALQVKRWHDRDKSGWWVLIGLVPIVGGIWVFVENGCLAGTTGVNRFGPPSA
jgi:uncharacterized membrane protein YhaH (DUF805 family)